MEKLKLNDGTVLQNCSAIQSGNDLFLYLNGKTFDAGYQVIREKARTKKITYTDNSGAQTVFTGFTKPVALRDEGDGMVSAVLRKG